MAANHTNSVNLVEVADRRQTRLIDFDRIQVASEPRQKQEEFKPMIHEGLLCLPGVFFVPVLVMEFVPVRRMNKQVMADVVPIDKHEDDSAL